MRAGRAGGIIQRDRAERHVRLTQRTVPGPLPKYVEDMLRYYSPESPNMGGRWRTELTEGIHALWHFLANVAPADAPAIVEQLAARAAHDLAGIEGKLDAELRGASNFRVYTHNAEFFNALGGGDVVHGLRLGVLTKEILAPSRWRHWVAIPLWSKEGTRSPLSMTLAEAIGHPGGARAGDAPDSRAERASLTSRGP
jgi:hypothetical protein